MTAMTDARNAFHWAPIEQVTTPPSGTHIRHYQDMWWATNGRGEVLLWRDRDGFDSPQGNRNRNVVDYMLQRSTWQGAGVTDAVLIDHAYLPDDPSRY